MYINLNEYIEPCFSVLIENPVFKITYQNDSGVTKTKTFKPFEAYKFLSFYYNLLHKKIKIHDYKIYGIPTNNKTPFIVYSGYILCLGFKVKLL
jgi:hypothetical protein